jgi:hypothetical protein
MDFDWCIELLMKKGPKPIERHVSTGVGMPNQTGILELMRRGIN